MHADSSINAEKGSRQTYYFNVQSERIASINMPLPQFGADKRPRGRWVSVLVSILALISISASVCFSASISVASADAWCHCAAPPRRRRRERNPTSVALSSSAEAEAVQQRAMAAPRMSRELGQCCR